MKKLMSAIILMCASMAYASEYLYITDGTSMKIVDVSQPTAPVLKGSIGTNSAYYVYVKEQKAYVGEFLNSDPFLNIIDVNDVDAPSLSYTFDKNNSLARVSDIVDDHGWLYIGDEYRGIHLLEGNSTVLSTQIHGAGDTMSLGILQDKLLAILQTSEQFRLEVLDIADPENPSTDMDNHTDIDAASYPMSDSSRHSWVRSDDVESYVANVNDMKLKKISSNDLTLLGSVDIGGVPTAMSLDGGYAYITMHVPAGHPSFPTTSYDGLVVVNLYSMTVVQTEDLESASGVVAHDDKVYVTDANGLHIYEMNAGQLALLHEFPDGYGNYVAFTTDNSRKDNDIHITGGGCSCTHDPKAKPDLVFFLLVIAMFLYPFRKKWLKAK